MPHARYIKYNVHQNDIIIAKSKLALTLDTHFFMKPIILHWPLDNTMVKIVIGAQDVEIFNVWVEY